MYLDRKLLVRTADEAEFTFDLSPACQDGWTLAFVVGALRGHDVRVAPIDPLGFHR